MNLTKNFSEKELACQHCGQCRMSPDLLSKLQTLREVFAKPLKITSGFRCEEHNLIVGGAIESQHTKGRAVDISTVGMASKEKFELMKKAFEVGFTGIGIAKTFLHVDVRKDGPSTWTY